MYKSKLQELCQKNSLSLPVYSSVKDGPDHCPRFTATVTIDEMVFHSPPSGAKSSKEAQNVAAKLAFEALSSAAGLPSRPAPSSPSVPNPLPGHFPSPNSVSNFSEEAQDLAAKLAIEHRLSTSGQRPEFTDSKALPPSPLVPYSVPASSDKVVIGPRNNEVLKQNHGSKPKDLLHLYKNQLLHHAQKNNLSHPEYSSEFDGPPHARRFKASVRIDGRTYQSLEYYPTVKDAEHAAAKVALDNLPAMEIKENAGLFKTLLQELAQKEGFHFPSYSTISSGLSHMPTFVSTVNVGGESYEGEECKTKKLAEMSAAKAAYDKLIERISSPNSTSSTNVDGLHLQPITSDNSPHIGAKMTPENHLKRAAGEAGEHTSFLSPGSDGKEPFDMSSPTVEENIKIGENGNVTIRGAEIGKRYRCSSENISRPLPEAFPSSPAFTNAQSMPSEIVTNGVGAAGGIDLPGSKVLIFRRGAPFELPLGASIVPHYDDSWVAVRLEGNQNKQA